jgi:16S rRNA (guanine966-N2)-methyltransferase
MRITGGAWRSRTIVAPKGDATRPSSDRVREALFSMLAAGGLLDVAPRVLDLYAGSGALALEALSRGAPEAVVVEHAREALAAIRENVRALGMEARVRIVAARVERAVAKIDGAFGLVVMDPPYAEVSSPAFAGVLAAAARVVAPAGALVLEHAAKDAPPAIAGLQVARSRRHGDTMLTIYRREG